MGSDHGRTQPSTKVIELREDVYDQALDGLGRDRMTVIHELGHVVMHQADRMLHRRGFGKLEAFRDPEWQAKAFAGEFLIPWYLIGRMNSVMEVAKKFGTSVEAAIVQLRAYEKDGLIKRGQIEDLPS